MLYAWIGGILLVAAMDLPSLLKSGEKRAVTAFLIVLAGAAAIAVLPLVGIEVPSALKFIGDFLTDIGLVYEP